jgi:large subunit ribosomal protein L15
MDLSSLSNGERGRKNRKRVGRGPGSGTGKTSGRGHKGQKARAGYSRRAGFEGGQMPLNRRLPKRGFHQDKRFAMSAINLDQLEKHFEAGDDVTPEVLLTRRLVVEAPGGVKVLGRGELTKKLTVRVNALSASAREKIESAGGTVEIVGVPKKVSKKAAEDASQDAGNA